MGRERRGQHGCGFSQLYFGRAVGGLKTALYDGDELGREEGERKERKTNGRQAGLSRKLSETQLLAGMSD